MIFNFGQCLSALGFLLENLLGLLLPLLLVLIHGFDAETANGFVCVVAGDLLVLGTAHLLLHSLDGFFV